MRTPAVLLIVALAGQIVLSAQARRGAPARRPPTPPKVEEAMVNCPTVLGQGAKTGRTFCDVLVERDPLAGITIPFPPHTGEVTLSFTLHNRHTYSETEIKNKRAYHQYTASDRRDGDGQHAPLTRRRSERVPLRGRLGRSRARRKRARGTEGCSPDRVREHRRDDPAKSSRVSASLARSCPSFAWTARTSSRRLAAPSR